MAGVLHRRLPVGMRHRQPAGNVECQRVESRRHRRHRRESRRAGAAGPRLREARGSECREPHAAERKVARRLAAVGPPAAGHERHKSAASRAVDTPAGLRLARGQGGAVAERWRSGGGAAAERRRRSGGGAVA
eukprot:7231620-Prymnesium_polylepis.1